MADLGTVVDKVTVVPTPWVQDVNDFVYRKAASSTNGLWGGGLIGDSPLLNYAVRTIGRAVHDIAYCVNNISGVDPTGATDSAAAINTFLSLVGDGFTLQYRGTYKYTSNVNYNSKNLTIDSEGSTFNLVGDGAGSSITGVVTYFRVHGGKIIGDGVNRDASSSNAVQVCWSAGNESGSQVRNVKISGVYMSLANIGIRFADGRGGGGTKTMYCNATNCEAFGMVGSYVIGGRGYGFHFAQADYSSLTNCTADGCGRHGIYFSEGAFYSAEGCKVFRNDPTTGALRGGFVISRSAYVTVTNLICANNTDAGLVIDTDSAGLAPDNVCDTVMVDNYVAYNNSLGDLKVGTSNPTVDGIPKNITVRMRSRVASGQSFAAVTIASVDGLSLYADIEGSASSGSFRAIVLNGDGGAAYTKEVEVYGSIRSAGYGIQVASAIQLGTQSILLKPSKIVATTAQYEFVGGENATTNNNLRYYIANGSRPLRTYSSSGAAVVLPAGGVGTYLLSASGVTTIAGFSGLTEGEKITVLASNGNSTLTNSVSLQLDGAVDITPTSADMLEFKYTNGVLRQRAKLSAN